MALGSSHEARKVPFCGFPTTDVEKDGKRRSEQSNLPAVCLPFLWGLSALWVKPEAMPMEKIIHPGGI